MGMQHVWTRLRLRAYRCQRLARIADRINALGADL